MRFLKIWRRIGKLFRIINRRQKLRLLAMLGVLVVASSFQVVTIGALPLIVMSLQNPEALSSYPAYIQFRDFVSLQDMPDTKVAIGGFIAAYLLGKAVQFLANYLRSALLRDLEVDIGRRLFGAYVSAPYTYHLNVNSAKLIRNLTQEVDRTVATFATLTDMVMNGITVVMVFALLFIVEPVISLAIVAVTALSGIAILLHTRSRSSRFGRQTHNQQGEMVKAINHAFGGVKDIRVLGKEGTFYRRYLDAIRGSSVARHGQRIVTAILRPVLEILVMAALGLIVTLVALRGNGFEQSLPILVLFAGGLVRVLPSVTNLIRATNGLYFKAVAVKTVTTDLLRLRRDDVLVPTVFPARSHDVIPFHQTIEVCGITFQYNNDTPRVLDDISLEIRRGEMIGFVGSTGSGKSTLIDLILGLLDPVEGTIKVDGRDIDHDIQKWRNLIGYVPQHIFLSDDTIRGNVAFGEPEEKVDDERVWESLRLSQIDEMVAELPDQLDSAVGERGVRISGGERQRIGLARALYHAPEVLIMDEGTSALDNVTERNLMESVRSLRSDHTIILVAHRLSTVRDCDRIFVFRSGRIVNSGAYTHLVHSSEVFRLLADAGGMPDSREILNVNRTAGGDPD